MKIRNTFYLLLCLLSISIQLKAQCPTRSYTNSWDWTTEAYVAYLRDGINYDSLTLRSPFYTPDNPSLDCFNSQPFAKKDFHPEDGWVLIRKQLGEPGGYANAVSNPYFILYNIHTGILRIFCAITEQHDDYSEAVIRFKFMDNSVKESALLSHFQPVTQPLDDFIKKVQMKSPSSYANQVGYWVYADFVMAYDPCTCYHLTKLQADIY